MLMETGPVGKDEKMYIHVEGLNKTYTVRKKKEHSFLREKTEVPALRDLSMDVEEGELMGYIGPNGAGKSTTVKILSGILTPDSGTVTVNGVCPWKERKTHVANIGVVFGQRTQLWWDVPVRDSYDLLKDIYRISPEDFRTRLNTLTEALDVGSLLDTPLRMLSLGQRMRVELAASLLHRPKLLFLDEPTIGLDAVSKLAIRDFLKEENRQNGTTVMLTTHDMEDISALCNRVVVIGKGRKLYDGALQDLLAGYDREHVITVRYQETGALPELPEGCTLEQDGDRLKITYETDKVPTGLLLDRLQKHGKISELTAQPQNVDRMVATMYKEMGM